jgi:hypothetical protein
MYSRPKIDAVLNRGAGPAVVEGGSRRAARHGRALRLRRVGQRQSANAPDPLAGPAVTTGRVRRPAPLPARTRPAGSSDPTACKTAGIALLLAAVVMVSSTTISRALLPKVPGLLMTPGLMLGAVGLALLTVPDVHAGYADRLLPAEILLGLGMGAVLVPALSTATTGVHAAEAGVASAVANTAEQIGASVGTALLNTVAASATASYLADRHHTKVAGLVHGYATAAGWAAAILLAAALIVGVLVNAGRPSGYAVATPYRAWVATGGSCPLGAPTRRTARG